MIIKNYNEITPEELTNINPKNSIIFVTTSDFLFSFNEANDGQILLKTNVDVNLLNMFVHQNKMAALKFQPKIKISLPIGHKLLFSEPEEIGIFDRIDVEYSKTYAMINEFSDIPKSIKYENFDINIIANLESQRIFYKNHKTKSLNIIKKGSTLLTLDIIKLYNAIEVKCIYIIINDYIFVNFLDHF